ncbi:MAG: InlB B-repeat-containing protein [Dysgonamonadaceae bacterium]|nr:InlB B-repeat-containing protein [Dysgonamonadaceae bacterium]
MGENFAWDFSIVDAGEALSVTFHTNGGSEVAVQYFNKENKTYLITEPEAPTKSGSIFNGWYTEENSGTKYEFPKEVTANTNIYAQWINLKDGLTALITSATELTNENNATANGKTKLSSAISTAQAVVNNTGATDEAVMTAIDELTKAVSDFHDKELTKITVNGTDIPNLSEAVETYYYLLSSSEAELTVTTQGSEYATIVEGKDSEAITISVTAGDGSTKTYTIKFVTNIMANWDNSDNSDSGTEDNPGSVGWIATPVTGSELKNWNNLNAKAFEHCYNDKDPFKASVGRMLVTDYGTTVYAFPVNLEEGKAYRFTGLLGAVDTYGSGTENENENEDPGTFNIDFNTEANRTGTSLANETYQIPQYSIDTHANVEFAAPTTGTYYFTFGTTTETVGLLSKLVLFETGDALTVTFNSNGGSCVTKQYAVNGDKVITPEEPKKPGFTFADWYSDEELETAWDFESEITENITLYAKWNKGEDFVIKAGESRSWSEYANSTYADIIIKSDATSTGQLTFTDEKGDKLKFTDEDNKLTINGVIKLQKTVITGKWYAVGFPFAVDSVNTNKEEFLENNWNPLKPWESGKGGDFWLKSYTHDNNNDEYLFEYTSESLAAGQGYIIQYPGYLNSTDISFVSVVNPVFSTDTLDVKKDYQLLSNPTLANLELTQGAGNNYYFQYDQGTNKFNRPDNGTTITIAPFESLIAINTPTSDNLKSAIAGGEEGTTGIQSLDAESNDDPIVATSYYTSVGHAIVQPLEAGLYLKHQQHQSGKVSVTKILIK